jgi:very-short-patch-repair endonuclease
VYVDKETESFQLYQKLYQNTIDHKTLDFVLVTKDTLTPALAIELDDSSRQREGLLGRDRQVDHVLSRTGLPLLHVRAGEAYDSKVLADAVDAAIKRGEAG